MTKHAFIILMVCSFPVKAANAKCKNVRNTQQLFYCAVEKSPSVLQGMKNLEAGSHLSDELSRIPNPQLNSSYIRSDGSGPSNSELEMSLMQSFKLGGKLDALESKGNAELKRRQGEFRKLKESQLIKVSSSIQRLRQIRHEAEIIDEGTETFEKIVRSYRKRPSLSAEQEISSEMFQLASEEHRFMKTRLFTEQQKLIEFLKLQTGLSASEILSAIPQKPPGFPEIDLSDAQGSELFSESLMAASVLEMGLAELDIEKSLRWTDLRMGPVFMRETSSASRVDRFGLGVSFELPLFQMNGSGVNRASLELEAAKIEASRTNKRISSKKDFLYNKYYKIKNDLNRSVAIDSIENRHRKIEKYFFKGLISSSLVIESHHKLIDYFRSRHELELEGLSTLWELQIIQGKIANIKM